MVRHEKYHLNIVGVNLDEFVDKDFQNKLHSYSYNFNSLIPLGITDNFSIHFNELLLIFFYITHPEKQLIICFRLVSVLKSIVTQRLYVLQTCLQLLPRKTTVIKCE